MMLFPVQVPDMPRRGQAHRGTRRNAPTRRARHFPGGLQQPDVRVHEGHQGRAHPSIIPSFFSLDIILFSGCKEKHGVSSLMRICLTNGQFGYFLSSAGLTGEYPRQDAQQKEFFKQ